MQSGLRSITPLLPLFLLGSLLVPLLAVPTLAAGQDASNLSQSSQPELLFPGKRVKRAISGAEVHLYNLEVKENQFVQLLVRQLGADVVTTLLDLDEQPVTIDRPNGSRGLEAVSFVAPRDGAYHIQLRMLERLAPGGEYEISVNVIREATGRDQSRMAAEVDITRGEVLRARGTAESLRQGVDKFTDAVLLWRALEDPYEVAVALYGRCLAKRRLGNHDEAISDCGESLRIMRELGDEYGMAFAQTGRGWSYLYLGEPEEALADFTQALRRRRQINDYQGELLDLYGVGCAHAVRGDYERALIGLHESVEILDAHGDVRGKPIRLASIGEVYRRLGQYRLAIDYLTKALKLSRALHIDRGSEEQALTSLGWSYLALGDLVQARKCYLEALPLRRESGDRDGQATTLLGLAQVEQQQGDLQKARANVESAIALIESLRSQVLQRPLRLSFFALAQDYYGFYVDLLMQMHHSQPEQGFAALALEASERARARSLLDLLSQAQVEIRSGVATSLLEREQVLHSKLNAAAAYQRQVLGDVYTVAQANAAAKDVADLTAALSETEAQILKTSPAYAALIAPKPLTARAIQREVADEDSVFLEYSLGKERSYVWAVTPTSITPYQLPRASEVERMVGHLRETLAAREQMVSSGSAAQNGARIAKLEAEYIEAARELSLKLISPVSPSLGRKRLLIVAPGSLQLVPFAALPDPPNLRVDSPLILRHEVVMLPSASVLVALRQKTNRRPRPARTISIFADPVYAADDDRLTLTKRMARLTAGSGFKPRPMMTTDLPGRMRPLSPNLAGVIHALSNKLPRLFLTRWEAEQIAALAESGKATTFLDFDANREAVDSPIVSGSRILHFATHTIIDIEHPELSGIALSMYDRQGQQLDGFFRALDIFNLRLDGDWVVLSSCRSALGPQYRGEGLVGLTRAFMYAGAHSVIASLWSTEDKATAELMVRFYRKLLGEGLRPGAALRAAQIEMLHDERWKAPYFWSGFVLQGEWK
jgi:CHAT domain-containing protein